MKKVGIYVRTSTTNGQSTERQVEELKTICDNYDYEIVDIYNDEGVSGAKKNRPELDRMMSDIFKRRFDTLMTLELSRLGRSVKNMCEILDHCNSAKVSLYVVNQQINTENPMGVFFFNMMNSISQLEREITRERIISGLNNARRKGVKLGRPSNMNEGMIKSVKFMRGQGVSVKNIAKDLKIGVCTVYKVLQNNDMEKVA